MKSTKKVFDECAQIYLNEDKHWGCDLDYICKYIDKFRNPEIIDLGVGHAWHLANLFFFIDSKLERVVGLDYSSNMLGRAKKLLNSILYNGHPIIEKVELKKGNILSIPFKKESFDIALLLNNTFGNIPGTTVVKAENKRIKALNGIKRILKKSGYLILSVYNSDKITEKDKYGNVFELDHNKSDFDKSDFIIRYKPTGSICYSHWFTLPEIKNILSDANFKVVECEKRKERIIIIAQKLN
jgi:SAM-dependent methyltransferase